MTDAPSAGPAAPGLPPQDLDHVGKLAQDMYMHVIMAHRRGMRFDEAVHALSLVGGLLLASGYITIASRKRAAALMSDTMLLYAARQDEADIEALADAPVAGNA